ncbi:MAG TPA: carboxypeptidase-like regulatory domain-containing protein [Candidatus Acidoferrum sp.]|nr:carboxypeptidase-like regulatory domain-containing protein [Candidatus Acidoferrum sp.]
MTAVLLTLTLLGALGQASPARQVGLYRIGGVVLDALTNVPVAHAQVSISRGGEQASTAAGDDGRFAFEGLEAGKYTLNATAAGYLQEAYNQHGAFMVAIAVGQDQDTEHLVFHLHPQAVIYGRVTDERGEAVRGAQVALFASDLGRGNHARTMRAEKQTNDLGEYRFAHLAAGKYYLAVQAQPWYAQPQLSAQSRPDSGSFGRGVRSFSVSGPRPGSDPTLDVVYPITFYPGVTDENSSAALVLSAGEREEANITLQAVPATHLRLASFNKEGATSFGVGASRRVFGTFTFGLNDVFGQVAPGEYEVAGLPPGDVTLVVTTNKANKGNEWTSRSIEVDSRSQGTIDAADLPVTAKVAGQVFLPGPSAQTGGGSVSLMSTSVTTLPGVTAPLQDDGTFNFPEIQSGTYRVQVNFRTSGHYVQKVVAKGAAVSGREFTITGGDDVNLTVTIGQGQGRVSGVVQSDGKPTSGVMVLLVPASGQEMEEDSRMDESDSDGSFTLSNILPGPFILLAIKDGWDLEWAKPGALEPYLPAGQKLTIAPNQSMKVTATAQEKTPKAERVRQ